MWLPEEFTFTNLFTRLLVVSTSSTEPTAAAAVQVGRSRFRLTSARLHHQPDAVTDFDMWQAHNSCD